MIRFMGHVARRA